MSEFVDLHLHSTHSTLDAFGHPDVIIARAKELGRKAIALTDHGSTSGHAMFEKEALAAGIKPIFGCEFYLVQNIEKMRENKTQEKSHISVTAKTQEGYRNLIRLVGKSYKDGFYYRPTIDLPMLWEHSEGLWVFSGCTSSLSSKAIIVGDMESASNHLKDLHTVFGDRFFLEVQGGPFKHSIAVNESLKGFSTRYNIPLIVTNDVHYPNHEDWQMRPLITAIRNKVRLKDMMREDESKLGVTFHWHYQTPYNELVILAEDGHIGDVIHQAAESTVQVAQETDVTLRKATPLEFPLSKDWTDKLEFLKHRVVQGFERRGLVMNEKYMERAEYEFRVIQEKGFTDYFLIVDELVNWAKDNGIFVGPARGSSAGSLICYLLGITEVDPLQFDLLFERFIDISRDDLPDIDIDFEDVSRNLVKNHLRNLYGDANVASVSVFITFQSRNAINDVGRTLQIDVSVTERFKSFIINTNGEDASIQETIDAFPEAKALYQDKDNQFKLAELINGQIRNLGKHAAGVVIGNEPLDEFMALYWDENDIDQQRTEARSCYDYDGCTYLGLIKIDILGLRALTRLKMMCNRVGMSLNDMYQISLVDERTMEGFRQQDLFGIFQFEGGTVRQVLSGMADLRNFGELVDISALARPGPLSSGGTNSYLKNRREPDDLGKTYLHPRLKEFTTTTHGQLLYQEQVLKIVRELGGFSWKDTNAFRKAIAKSKGREELEKYRKTFVANFKAMDWGTSQDADRVFDATVTFGAYGFNLSHAVSYTLLSWYLMYFKVHHSTEFYWASITTEDDEIIQRRYITEFCGKGGSIYGPKFSLSEPGWTVSGEMVLRAGYLHINGIGDKGAAAIQAMKHATENVTAEYFEKHINKRSVNSTRTKQLIDMGFFSDEEDVDYMSLKSDAIIFDTVEGRTKIGDIDYQSYLPELTVAGRIVDRTLHNMNEPKRVANRMARYGTHEFKNPENDEWINIRIEDETGDIECMIDRYDWPGWKAQLSTVKDGERIIFRGKKQMGRKMIFVEKMFKWS